ncbi:MAG: tRNA (adenosine(37)-N6)-dimethylallyltransferase MiaA [Flavobacteriia bacterium]|nr:tRNA (adenosine(37)-N6)-dimethylallyltransferase MiaA [Flavobacteriia bacterium]
MNLLQLPSVAVNDKKLIIVQGPTASGKTAFSIALAKHFHTEIISGDSRQFYKEMIIGTARPSINELKTVKHHFISSHSVLDEFNTSDFSLKAREICANLFETKDQVILVGGSGMYIDALTFGLDEIKADESIRQALNQIYENQGLDILVNELQEKDPEFCLSADLKNPVRVIRALEVIRMTNQPYSSQRKGFKNDLPYDIVRFSIAWKREDLYDRINLRVDEMITNGLVEEVIGLQKFQSLSPLKTLGYSEIFDVINNKCSLETAIEKIKQHSRNYAKRQMTWLRRYSDVNYLDPYSKDTLISQAIAKMST